MDAKPAEVYLGLRNRILSSPLPPGHSAFIMDWPVGGAMATVVAVSDGTVSIYLSSGGGFIGGGQGHASIRQAGEAALAVASELKSQLLPANSFPLPKADMVSFYLVTGDGVLSAIALEADLRSGRSQFARLGAAAQEIVTQYRLKYQKPKPTIQ